MKIAVKVRLKQSILDPQGKTVNNALHHLGFNQIQEVRIGKLIEMEIDDSLDAQQAYALAEQASRKLLANQVIEEFEIEQLEKIS
ncbi:MAG: phosphoribosylformylglycinamidine synthase subunit PurS [Calditrichae bacterium]|nr:phosphoribosylformylglycinamidine synthase subunit PurS [Calditrichia bacterium]NIW78217.1 phosphoribosylformylglycinamidine synthase subunit PurS [Calditrichia bacterium]